MSGHHLAIKYIWFVVLIAPLLTFRYIPIHYCDGEHISEQKPKRKKSADAKLMKWENWICYESFCFIEKGAVQAQEKKKLTHWTIHNNLFVYSLAIHIPNFPHACRSVESIINRHATSAGEEVSNTDNVLVENRRIDKWCRCRDRIHYSNIYVRSSAFPLNRASFYVCAMSGTQMSRFVFDCSSELYTCIFASTPLPWHRFALRIAIIFHRHCVFIAFLRLKCARHFNRIENIFKFLFFFVNRRREPKRIPFDFAFRLKER